MFFFEKKNQKTFIPSPPPAIWRWPIKRREPQETKVFWFFFSKKNILPSLLNLPPESLPLPLHLIKLSVGSQSLDDLREWQSLHGAEHPPLRHRTRNFPRRAEEILDGGSIYWVINRIVTARQFILDIREAVRDDGSACADILLDPLLVPVRGRFMKPFQGWRYLAAADAPADVVNPHYCAVDLPDALRRELLALALL